MSIKIKVRCVSYIRNAELFQRRRGRGNHVKYKIYSLHSLFRLRRVVKKATSITQLDFTPGAFANFPHVARSGPKDDLFRGLAYIRTAWAVSSVKRNRVATLARGFYRLRKIQFFRRIIHSALPPRTGTELSAHTCALLCTVTCSTTPPAALVRLAMRIHFVDVQMRRN